MSRTPLDTWTKREHLCLASAVSCSGDQNWITVSRTLKSVCGNNGNTRPADWYSQKNCAVQYGHLLETVETTKRKKRTNESSGFSSPATVAVETPTELLLRRLTEERLAEIKTQMRRDQELYSKVQREIESLQSDMLSEQQLQQMWQEIEKEQETKRIDEMKLENRMREREQRKKDVGSWRNNSNTAATRRSNLTADTTSVDMDVEDITGTSTAPANNTSTSSNTNKHQAAPAPLLTSLLKSPGGSGNNATAANNVTSPTTTPATVGLGSIARATAPTITSLLTSGASAMPNQPAIVAKNLSDPAFMTRPISGPPVAEVATTGRSPSQAAPTLSMLLEKNKLAAAGKAAEAPKATDAEATTNPKPAAEVEASAAEAVETLDESDAEEQQLLEVFKNMDDIMDDIDIDMASVIDEDLLKDVNNVDSPPATTASKPEVVDFEDKLDALKREQGDSRKSSKSPTVSKVTEVVLGSSDDSNDNIPLAAVASQESKDRSQSATEGNTSTAATPNTHEVTVDELSETITIASSSSEDNAQEIPTEEPSDKLETNETAAKATSLSPTPEAAEKQAEESVQQPAADVETEKTPTTKVEAAKEDATKTETAKAATTDKTAESIMDTKTSNAPAAASSVHDTDEESSSLTDSSKATDEPARSSKSKSQAEHKHETDSSAVQPRQSQPSSITPAPAAVPARPPLLRKLNHHDRSASPMVDDDTTTASDHSTARSSSRRRCSSTPVIDSIPNSPASSEHTDDRRETRGASKKLFLSIYSSLLESKHAAPFRRPFHDEHPLKQADLCLRPMDLPTIKRNIDSGHLRNISELHRDVLLMCHNLLLMYKPSSAQHKTARLFLQECQALKEFATSSHHAHQSDGSSTSTASGKHEKEKEKEKEKTPAGNKARSGSRKSQRHH
ncbi:bromodomain-containing protein 8 [Drosophila nasuta]|uniref:bromodomain-containing protein 8 n=1 Tax=Drosophila nasuta TaxID=42062 RepID=UPI00295E95FA|nr:bromodomain-containing protein 8 [Drosophila nasuta]